MRFSKSSALIPLAGFMLLTGTFACGKKSGGPAALFPGADAPPAAITIGQPTDFDGPMTATAGLKAPFAYVLQHTFALTIAKEGDFAVNTSAVGGDDSYDNSKSGLEFKLLDASGKVLLVSGDAVDAATTGDGSSFPGHLAAGSYQVVAIFGDDRNVTSAGVSFTVTQVADTVQPTTGGKPGQVNPGKPVSSPTPTPTPSPKPAPAPSPTPIPPTTGSLDTLDLTKTMEFSGALTQAAGLASPYTFAFSKSYKLIVTTPVNLQYSSASISTYSCGGNSTSAPTDQSAAGYTLLDATGRKLQSAGDALAGSIDETSFGGPLAAGTYVIQVTVADDQACSADISFQLTDALAPAAPGN